ncbi:hemolysin III family protein [bacterium]|nr:MAG: hemolysin III family protein [bacterium]
MRGAFAHEDFSTGEEIAHSVTHGLGALGATVSIVLLVLRAVPTGDARTVVAVSIYGASMLMLYTASTLYHALTAQRAKRVFQLMDHGAIYLLIAGSYTPFTLVALGGSWGWSLFGVTWGLAILGILYEVVLKRPWKRVSLMFYLIMGWMAVIAARPLAAALPHDGLLLLGVGGLFYSGGAVFYAWRAFPYHHAVWHLCVMAGSASHFLCILWYVIPA